MAADETLVEFEALSEDYVVTLPVVDASQTLDLAIANVGLGTPVRRVQDDCGALLGLRWGECAGLRLGRIDFVARRAHIVEQLTRARHGQMVVGPPKSEAGRRSLGALAALLEMLASHVTRHGLLDDEPDALLFTEANGDLLDYSNWRSRVWLPPCKGVGLDGLVFHDLRRLNATALVAEGVDLKTAQSRLGHSDTIASYALATTDGDRAAADRIAARLMPSGSNQSTVQQQSHWAGKRRTTDAPWQPDGQTPDRSEDDAIDGAENKCAMNAPWASADESTGATVIPLTRRNRRALRECVSGGPGRVFARDDATDRNRLRRNATQLLGRAPTSVCCHSEHRGLRAGDRRSPRLAAADGRLFGYCPVPESAGSSRCVHRRR